MADEKFEAIIKKIQDKVALEDTDCYYLVGKSDPASLERYKTLTDVFFDYVKSRYEKKEAGGNAALYIGICYSKQYESDPSGALVNMPKILDLLKVVSANMELLDKDDTWKNGIAMFTNAVWANVGKAAKYYREMAPIFVPLLGSKQLGQQIGGVLSQMHTANSRLLVPFIEQIIDAIGKNETTAYLLTSFQQAKPEAFHNKVDKIWEYFLNFDTNYKSSIIGIIWNISKEKPDLLVKYVTTPDFKDALFGQTTGTMAAYTVKEVAAVHPELFVDWIDDLVDAMKSMTAGFSLVPMALSNIARANPQTATKICQIFMDSIKERRTDGTAVMMMLMGMKSIQDKYKEIVGKHLPEIKALNDHPDANVRNYVDAIVAVAENKDLKSVSSKVEQHTTEIKEVKQDVKDQGVKIEQVDTKVKEQTVRVDKVEKDVKETKQEVKVAVQKVDKLEVKVDEHGKQIKEILDKFDEMNEKVKNACKSYDDIKAYVDKNVETLKDFVASVAKKLPSPFKFTSSGKIRRTLTLYFHCGHEYADCMYPKSAPYTTETKDWAKWLKVSMSLVKLGKAIYDKEIFDIVDHVKSIYEDIASKEDKDFVAYISQPFLTSTEQDNLVEQLRDQRFFEFFDYSAQTAQWVCVKCAKKENDKRSGKTETTATGTATPSSPKPKVTSWMEVNIGMFGKFSKFWCIYEQEKIGVYKSDSAKHIAKPKKSIHAREVIKFTELDSRVEKKENVFALVTKEKQYKFAASSKEVYATWKDLFKQ